MDTMDDDEPVVRPTGLEVMRCRRGTETRIYTLRVVPDGAELWRVTESDEGERQEVQESHFTNSAAAAQFLDEVRRALVAGGWRAE